MSVVKVNTDGATKGNHGEAGAGCVLWDHDRKQLVRSAQNVGIATSITA